MNRPFPAYKGDEPYVFVCYAHKDAGSVYPDLELLDRNNINVWYDEGIPAGRSWRAEIATAIKGAKYFLLYISEASIASAHCLREIDYALNNDVSIVPVHLDDASLPPELDLALSRVQALFKKSDSMYPQHLVGALRPKLETPLVVTAPKPRTFRVALIAASLGMSLLAVLLWATWSARPDADRVGPDAVAVPNAVDSYLQGLELVERWDKDDNLDTAIRLFREASTADPSFALAFARLADALRIRYALTSEDAWLREATNSANRALELNANLAPVQVALGRVYAARGNIDLALAALERALAIDANNAAAYEAIGRVYERSGRLEDAEASFQKAVALDPDNPTTRDAYGNFLYAQSRFEEAAREWQALLRLAPDHYAALVNLGSALSEAGRIAESIDMYERAIDIRPNYMAYSNLGTAYSRGGRYMQAVEAYLEAIAIDGTDWLAWGNLAYVYSWMDGRDVQAGEAFERAIELAEAARQRDPREPFVHSDLALYYAKTDRPELALQRLETALVLAPGSTEILAAGAEVHELLGQRAEAIDLIRRSIELGFAWQQLQRNRELADLLTDARVRALQ